MAGRPSSITMRTPVHGAGEIRRIRVHMLAGQGRQDHGADGHGKEAEGKLQQPVRVIEIADGTGGQEGGQHGVDQQVDLADRDTEQGGIIRVRIFTTRDGANPTWARPAC